MRAGDRTTTIRRKMFVMSVVPITAILLYGGFFIKNKARDYSIAKTMVRNIECLKATTMLLREVQVERGKTNLYLNGAIGLDDLNLQRRRTDGALNRFKSALQQSVISSKVASLARSIPSKIRDLRIKVEQGRYTGAFKEYTQVVQGLLDMEQAAAQAKTSKGVGKRMTNVIIFEMAKEHTGQFRGRMAGILAADKPVSMDVLKKVLRNYDVALANLTSPALVLSPEAKNRVEKVLQSRPFVSLSKALEALLDHFQKGHYGLDPVAFFSDATRAVDAIDGELVRSLNDVDAHVREVYKSARRNMIGIGVGSGMIILLIAGLSLWISRSTVDSVASVAYRLKEASDHVSSAASQVSASSQSVADGTSQQAAAIEETSSALEETSSMTRQNAENAAQANGLMKEAAKAAEDAKGAMAQLLQSMDQIISASQETQKIIKTIDEIAFQTNLLALNAAVEAARAGEAGAGFAVVADEVRSLAMRAAEAAKNTAELIEDTSKRIRDGGQLTSSTNEAFEVVHENVAKVAELISEIMEASKEQAEGITQVNSAVAEMDKAVQQNAANAQESASVAEELTAQAHEMQSMVGYLVALCGSGKKLESLNGRKGLLKRWKGKHETPITKAKTAKEKGGQQKVSPTAVSATTVKPEELIPFDEEDFSDF